MVVAQYRLLLLLCLIVAKFGSIIINNADWEFLIVAGALCLTEVQTLNILGLEHKDKW
jgi:hypothetical protein